MSNLTVTVILLGSLVVTSYRSVPEATDSTPFNTSTGEIVSRAGVAVSQDLLCKACRRLHKRCKRPDNSTKLHYGDCLFIEDAGFKIINDCMGLVKHERVKTKRGIKRVYTKQLNWIDEWVPSYKEEHEFHKKYGVNKHRVWLIKEIK